MPVELFASSTQVPCLGGWVEGLRRGWLLECVQVLTVDCVVLHQLARVPSGERQLAAAWKILRVSHTTGLLLGVLLLGVQRIFTLAVGLLLCWPPLDSLSLYISFRSTTVEGMCWHPPHTAVLFGIECFFACAGGGARACADMHVVRGWCLARQSVYILCLVFAGHGWLMQPLVHKNRTKDSMYLTHTPGSVHPPSRSATG